MGAQFVTFRYSLKCLQILDGKADSLKRKQKYYRWEE